MDTPERAGHYQTQPGGHRCFIPQPLPPEPPLAMSATRWAEPARPNMTTPDHPANSERVSGFATALPRPPRYQQPAKPSATRSGHGR